MPERLDVEGLRAELRAWLDEQWDPTLSLVEWRERLCDGGWARVSWPARWGGRELPASATALVEAELSARGAVGGPDGVGAHLAAPTILEHGPDLVRERYLRATLTGAISWCQLFSEPGAGSDLAGLTTHARRDGDEWIVRGQKVWTTSAAHADVGLLLCRTDWDVPKHAGITCLVVPMRQDGVEVRPLRQMNGHASFNEVFLDEARIRLDDVVGEVHGGWKVAVTTLAHERRMAVLGRGIPLATSSEGRVLEEAVAESARVAEPYRWYPQRAGRVDLIVSQAKATRKDADPLVRQEVAGLLALNRASQLNAERATAARRAGRPPGPEGSIGKLASSEIARRAARVHTRLAGATAMLDGPDAPLDGLITEVLVSVPAISIAGGTDEIQHNIVGERVLGLPKEPDDSRTVAFSALRDRSGAPGQSAADRATAS